MALRQQTIRADDQARSATRRPARDGFSLLELTVAVAVLAVLSVGAMLNFQPWKAGSDATRFSRLFAEQSDLAVVARTRRMLQVTPGGITPHIRVAGEWRPVGAPWRPSRRTVLVLADLPVTGPDVIQFLPDGRTSAFRISFGADAACWTDGFTALACGAP